MTTYLGISMVIIVAAICIAGLIAYVNDVLFKQYEAHKQRIADKRFKEFAKYVLYIREQFKEELNKIIEEIGKKSKTGEKYSRTFVDTVDYATEKLKDEGIEIEDL